MRVDRPDSAGAVPPLVVRAQAANRTLPAGPSYRLGRDPESDLVVDDPRVSWSHAVLRLEGDQWLLEDVGSTNGTWLGSRRVQQVEITGACLVRLGHPDDGPAVFCSLAAVTGSHGTELAGLVRRPPTTPPPASSPDPPPGSSPDPPPDPQQVHSPGLQQPRAEPQPSPHPPPPPGLRKPSARLPLLARLRIGRAEDNEVVVPDLSVSRYHAELRQVPSGGYEIVDLDSSNGTYLNGQRINSAPVAGTDVIGVGPSTFRLVSGELQEFIDTGDVRFNARGLTVRLTGGKVILDDVSFPLGERCLLGVIGPSGAGKSTLLGALTGMRPATGGTVMYDDRDLYSNYAELRHRIGLVPQENILHMQLSARRALQYAAELRFPRDTSPGERERRIDEVLEELSLTQHAGTRASLLSGGQQKRVNVALELLTKPSLLFLDEPTSGLDPGLDMQVMEMMSGLAHDGRTVVVVTHSVANLDICDRLLVLVPGGKVAYFGPPADGLKHFGQPGWAQVFRAFEAEPGRDWAGEYRRSAFCAQYVTADSKAHRFTSARPGPVRRSTRPARPAAVPRPRSRNRLAQLSTLARRYLSVITADRNFVAVLAILPVVLGGLIRAVPDPGGLAGRGNGNAHSVLLVLVLGACLTGIANAVRELVKEQTIYARERATGLSAAAYLWSKLVVLGVICGAQAVVLVFIGVVGRPLPPRGAFLPGLPLVELMLAIAVLAVGSMTVGLLISALVNSSDKTMPLLVVAVLVEVVLSGAVFPLNGKIGLEQFSWLSPSRWGFGALAATSNLNQIQPPTPGVKPDPLWNQSAHNWLMSMALQVVLAIAFVGLSWRRLNQVSPGRRR